MVAQRRRWSRSQRCYVDAEPSCDRLTGCLRGRRGGIATRGGGANDERRRRRGGGRGRGCAGLASPPIPSSLPALRFPRLSLPVSPSRPCVPSRDLFAGLTALAPARPQVASALRGSPRVSALPSAGLLSRLRALPRSAAVGPPQLPLSSSPTPPYRPARRLSRDSTEVPEMEMDLWSDLRETRHSGSWSHCAIIARKAFKHSI